MTVWKPYRVLFRQGYHYFETLTKAREFIKNFEKAQFHYLMIEKMDKVKFKSNKYRYDQLYDTYEVWTMERTGKWKLVKK